VENLLITFPSFFLHKAQKKKKKCPCLFLCPIYNGHMQSEGENLKDSSNNLGIVIKDIPISISYKKTNKLITALYMVTDIIPEDEPLRNKLRTLGAGIVSDMHQMPERGLSKISELMSFLGIAKALGIISEMNCNILEKEFSELNQSIKESSGKNENQGGKEVDLSEFFRGEIFSSNQLSIKDTISKYPAIPAGKGHPNPTRIGVQKGGTLLKALSDRTGSMSDRNSEMKSAEQFDILKKQRRAEVVSFIKTNGGSATITDIKTRAGGLLAKCGEKTLQRELLSMHKDGVLKKTGEKRWSRYSL
jgi:hypothetical protein